MSVFVLTTVLFSVIWDPVKFKAILDSRVADLPSHIKPMSDFRDFVDCSLAFGYAEVLDHWYIVAESLRICDMGILAQFVRAPEGRFGPNAYFAYFSLSQQFKERHKAAYTQLMDPGDTVDLTFWQSREILEDKHTKLT